MKIFVSPWAGILVALLCSCNPLDTIDPPGIVLKVESDSALFAVIGDYGKEGEPELKVSILVKSWQPDFILTTGDNNYEYGDYSTLHRNIGQFYGNFIYNYDAPLEYRCSGKASKEEINRFFPSPGNHDRAGSRDLQPYLNYFTLPGQEEYYSFIWGNAVFFSLNSLPGSDLEVQRAWLEEEAAGAGDRFRIVYFHHPPYSPGSHGDTDYMQWDFHRMGVDVVLSGHDHIYAHMEMPGEEGLHYIVNGLGGKSIYSCQGERLDPDVVTVACYNKEFGAMRCLVTLDRLEMAFYPVDHPETPVDVLLLDR